jgi:hypothetical protein
VVIWADECGVTISTSYNTLSTENKRRKGSSRVVLMRGCNKQGEVGAATIISREVRVHSES